MDDDDLMPLKVIGVLVLAIALIAFMVKFTFRSVNDAVVPPDGVQTHNDDSE